MKNNLYAILAAVSLCLGAFAGCQQDIGWVHDLENGDYSKVRFERAPSRLQPFAPAGDDESCVARIQGYFAEHQPLLNTLAAQGPCIESSSLEDFKLQCVCTDQQSGELLVQFFAHYEHPQVFAGRQVQFLLSGDRQLEAVYVHDMPLEQ